MDSSAMVHTAFRLPEELLRRLDRHLEKIRDKDPLKRGFSRSEFIRLILIHNLGEESGDE